MAEAEKEGCEVLAWHSMFLLTMSVANMNLPRRQCRRPPAYTLPSWEHWDTDNELSSSLCVGYQILLRLVLHNMPLSLPVRASWNETDTHIPILDFSPTADGHDPPMFQKLATTPSSSAVVPSFIDSQPLQRVCTR